MTIKNLFKLRNLLGFSKKRDKIMTDRKDNLEKLTEELSVKKEGKYNLEIFKEMFKGKEDGSSKYSQSQISQRNPLYNYQNPLLGYYNAFIFSP